MPAPQLMGLGLSVPLTSFSMFTKPSTRVLLPSCRKVRSRGWGENKVREAVQRDLPLPWNSLSLGDLLSSGHSEQSWEGTESQNWGMKNVDRGAQFGKTLTFENQRHERNHGGFHLGDHVSVAFVVPARVLAFHGRGIKGQIGQCTPKTSPIPSLIPLP